MSLPIFQRTIVNGQGDVVNGATVEVRRESDNALAVIYSDRAGTIIRANPFFTDASGLAQFYVAAGEYRVTATIGGDQVTWRWVALGIPNGSVGSLQLADGGVTLAKLQPVSTLSLLGRGSAGTGVVEQLAIGSGLSVVGGALTAEVGGLPAATLAEAQAGTSNTVAITPLRLRNALNASGSAPIYACRAWVNFKGAGTVAIRASGNVSSITDNGVGDYTVNFTTAMPDANYAPSMSVQRVAFDTNLYPSLFFGAAPTQTGSGFRFQVRTGSSFVIEDPTVATVAVFR